LKKTKRAERISPTPTLKAMRHKIGNRSVKNSGVTATLSIMQKTINTANVKPKFMREQTFLDMTKRYFGTLIFENISEFDIIDAIPPLAASEK
jgi:hypothetical protein